MNEILHKFYRSCIVTTLLIYILILVGGFVRVTSTGDDCPDWPKCYGSWFPPTIVSDIPDKFTPSQDKVYGAWIEYFNRLVGVIVGLSMIYTFSISTKVRTIDKKIFYSSFISLVLIIISGWFGGQIAQNINGENMINQHTVSIHLYLAMLIVIIMVYTSHRSFLLMNPTVENNSKYSNITVPLIYIIFSTILLDIISGSLVRTFIDSYSMSLTYFQRIEKYATDLGFLRFIHPVLGFLLLTIIGIFWNHIMNLSKPSKLVKLLTRFLFYIVIFQVVLGEGLRYGLLHESFRLYHLWLGSCLLGIVVLLMHRLNYHKTLR